ncbi:MAG: peroxide stress protein YaaA [Pseudomonadota bacterium]
MLVVISPAKRLDWSEPDGIAPTQPAFQEDAAPLARAAGRLSRRDLQTLMDISEDLATLNKARFTDFRAEPSVDDVRPAAFAFAGDTYQGLEARTLDPDALAWSGGHLRILSGLYGLLRPLDGIQPYRLEMGSRLKTRKGPDLYAYWGDRIAQALNLQAEAVGAQVLVNCASQEYFGAVELGALKLEVVTPVFLEEKPGGPKIVSFFAKRARGAMARWIMERRLTDPGALTDFDSGGYAFTPELSEAGRPTFVRPVAAQEGQAA